MSTNQEQDSRLVKQVTWLGLTVNLILAAAKFLFGWFASSQALIADAVHSLTDTLTDMAVLVGVRYWSAPADKQHPYGHHRIETFVSLFIGLVLGATGLGLVYHAVSTLNTPPIVSPGWKAFWTACVAIVVKEWMYRYTIRAGKKIGSAALIANAWHHRSDALSSIPVALAILGMWLRPDWTYLDHAAALVVALLVAKAAGSIVWNAFQELIDVGVSEPERKNIVKLAGAISGVREIHGLRTRHMGGGHSVDLHVLVDPELTVREGHAIAAEVKHLLMDTGPDILDVLVHIEPYEEATSKQ